MANTLYSILNQQPTPANGVGFYGSNIWGTQNPEELAWQAQFNNPYTTYTQNDPNAPAGVVSPPPTETASAALGSYPQQRGYESSDGWNAPTPSSPYTGNFADDLKKGWSNLSGGIFSGLGTDGGEGGSLTGALGLDSRGLGNFSGSNLEDQSQAWDLTQKTLGGLGNFVASPFALGSMVTGEVARQKANEAFDAYGNIGFFEDIMSPDFMYGSPDDILKDRKDAVAKAMRGEELDEDEKAMVKDYNKHTAENGLLNDIANSHIVDGRPTANPLTENNMRNMQAMDNVGLLNAMTQKWGGPQGALLDPSTINQMGQQRTLEERKKRELEVKAQKIKAAQAAARAAAGRSGSRGSMSASESARSRSSIGGGALGGGGRGSSSAGESNARGGNEGGGSGYTCFHEDALVTMADGTAKRIAEIVVGDFVDDTNGGSNKVVDIDTPDLGSRTLYRMNGSEDFVTWDHPFLREDGKWVSISPENSHRKDTEFFSGTLQNGTVLQTNKGNVTVEGLSSKNYDDDMKLYDLHLDGNHRYYANGFVVHNC